MKYILTFAIGCIAVVLAGVDSGHPQEQVFNNNVTALTGIDLNAFSVPSIEETERVFKEKCEKNGGPEAYGNVQVAKDQVTECVQSLVNITELQEEMESAKPKGDLDLVFRKYCQKSHILQDCTSYFTSTVERCLEHEEKEIKRVINNITHSLLEFICFKDGDRIALFIAEGGPLCFVEKRSGIEACLNETISKYIPEDMSSINTLPVFVLGEKECVDVKVLQRCVVKVLEQCSETTPANIVESLFNYVWKSTPCSKMTLQYSEDAPDGTRSSLMLKPTSESLQSEMEPLESRIEPLQSRIEPLQSRTEPLQSEMELLQSRLELLQPRIELLQSTIEKLQSTMEQLLQSTIGQLQSRIEQLQSKIETLQSRIEPIQW